MSPEPSPNGPTGNGPWQPDPGLRDALIRLAGSERLLVALDFDGTLSPIVPTPSAARPAPGALDVLARLAEIAGTDLALISGRARADLAEVSMADGLASLIGSHGQEVDATVALDSPELARLVALRELIREHVAAVPGVLVEDKPAGLAIHVRACSREDAAIVIAAVGAAAAQFPGTHRIDGKQVVELSVRPLDKGSALGELIASDPQRAVLFAGDDVTDEAALAALRAEDVGIKVGPGDTVARHRVEDPDQVVELLALLADLRAGRAGPTGPSEG